MQTLGNLHNQLAYIIGDSIAPITSNIIPDGQRFSKQLREVYLQRALDEVLSEIINQLVSLPASIKSEVASKLFPTTLTTTTVLATLVPNSVNATRFGGESTIQAFTTLAPRIAMFVTATYNASTGTSLVNGQIPRVTKPIPIHDPIRANSLINSRSTQTPDMFFKSITYADGSGQWVNDLYLYDYQGEVSSGDSYISISYIEYPVLLNTLTNYTDVIKFEDMYMNRVYQKAAMYARIDSQEEDYQMQGQQQ